MNQPILLVHEDILYLERIKEALNERGFFVIAVSDIETAFDAISAGVYDVAIIGANIKGYSGIRMVSKIKFVCSLTKIIFINDESMPEEFFVNNSLSYPIDRVCRFSQKPEQIADQVVLVMRTSSSAPEKKDSQEVGIINLSRDFRSRSSVPASMQKFVSIVPEPALKTSQSTAIVEDSAQMSDLDMETERKLLELAREYQKNIPNELLELKELIRAAMVNPEDEEIYQEIRRRTHTICGTAGTLGFFEISDTIGQINEKIKKLEAQGGGSKEQWNNLEYLMDRAISTPERSSLVPCGMSVGGTIATILVIGSDRGVLVELSHRAKSCLVELLVACTKVEALAEISNSKVHGIIIDMDMENPPPIDLAHEIHGLEGMNELGIAFMSTIDTVDRRIAAVSAGAVQFLDKPVEDEALVELAREFASVSNSTNARILIVDDDEFFRKHVKNILESARLEVHELSEPGKTLETLELLVPDILLLDVQMPVVSGWDVCRMIRSVPKWRNLPVLFLTGESDASARIECFRAGGDDYIQKPCIKEELLARINVRLERIRLFRERADKDPLTQLLNRRAFLEQVQRRMDEGKRFDRPLSFCVIDLDKFKIVNDDYGHLAGDRVLAAIGKLLSSRFRTVDVRGRWGGEEFAVCFYNENAQAAKQLLTDALDSFRKIVFTSDAGENFNCTFSAGVATFPKEASDFDELFKIADACLYKAKEEGRNQVCINQ